MVTSRTPHRALSFTVAALLSISLAWNSSQAQTTGCVVNVTHSDDSGFELELELFDLEIKPVLQDGIDRNRISISGETSVAAPGMPELPHINRLIAVPPTARIELSWSGAEPVHIASTPPLIISTETSSGTQAFFNDIDYSTPSGYWPENVVDLGKPAIMRGVRIVRLTINPVQVNTVTGDLLVWERINVRLNYTTGEAINPVQNVDRPRPSKTATRLIRSLVLNPESVRRDQDRRGSFVYVIPDYEGVGSAIAPLVNWRKRQGYLTEVIVVDERASNVDVKDAIEEAYFEWDVPPEFICLVGDADLENSYFMIPTWDVGRAYMWETDYHYVCMEGDDLLPEMAIGRISARRISELTNIVEEKIYPYEAEPYMENSEWYQRAALMANDARTGMSSIFLQRWARKLLLEIGFTEVDTFYFRRGEATPGGHDFIEDNINDGILLFNYRGWGFFNGDWSVGDVSDLVNEQMLPFILMPTCNTGDFADHIQNQHAYSEDFLWGRRGGAIGCVGSSGFTHTNYNNVFTGGVLNGFFRDEAWEFGWALNQGKLELYRHFGMFNDVDDPQVNSLKVWEAHVYQNNLIGDPGTQIWTNVPQEMDVDYPERVSIGENRIIISVEDYAEESPLTAATVTLMRGGEHVRIGETDSEGRVIFTFEPDELQSGGMNLTVTKHDYIPFMEDIFIGVEETFLGVSRVEIDDNDEGESRGNDDGNPNPGERIELHTWISNFGEIVPEGVITLSLEPVLGDVEVVGEDVEIESPGMDEDLEVVFVIDLGYACWDNQRVLLNLTAASQDNEWSSPIEFFMAATNIECVDFIFDPDPFHIGDTVWVDVTFHNDGQLASPAMDVELFSLQDAVVVFNPFAEIDPISIEDGDTLATARFRIHAYPEAIPGTYVPMLAVFESEGGFCDSAYFGYTVDSPSDGTPFGPDAYGYGCFDNSDASWDIAPEYDWVEIDPDLDGPGTDTDIDDLGNEQDWSVLIELPFTFQYYGEEFDELTICSNGWLAFGDESKLADFQNRRIPPALGPRAQVCVFWDDLINYIDDGHNRIGGIYHWYDEQNHCLIIEWSRMRRYIGLDENHRIRPGGLNTFQAILYDPQFYQTYSGDGDIVFYYHTVNNDAAVDPAEFDTPYATVGIVNLNGTDGMEYTYWNQYPAGAAELEDERAIKFTTALRIVTGAVSGTVVDAATNRQIEGAEIRGNPTSFGITDRNGEFNFPVLVGDDYSFTVWAAGYNEATIHEINIRENETSEIHFSLLHPDFDLSMEIIEVELAPDHITETSVTISNSGNGPLIYRGYYDYLGGDDDERWNRILDFDVSGVTGDMRIHGVVFFADSIWVSGSNNSQNPNKFYLFNREGEFIRAIDQPTESSYGFRGLAVIDDILYGGENYGEWRGIIGLDPGAAPVDSIPGPLQIHRAIAYDPETETFWIANSTDPVIQIDREGNVLNSFQFDLDIQGLAFLPSDPDGHPLYIASRDKTRPDPQIPEAMISKIDPSNGHRMVEAVLTGEPEDKVGGMEIVSTYDARKWMLLAVMTNPNGDHVSVYDIGPNTNWITFAPRVDTVEAGGEVTINMHFNTTGLAEGEYGLAIRFVHNAAGLETNLPVVLTVDSSAYVYDGALQPFEFSLDQNFPNPFNSMTVIRFNLPVEVLTRLTLFDIGGRRVATIFDGKLNGGRHTMEFDAGGLPSGVYMMRLDAGANSALIKLALIR